MYWVTPESPAVYHNEELRSAVTSTLSQLYDRKYCKELILSLTEPLSSSRHEFCPSGHWAVEEIAKDPSKFMREVAQGEEHALAVLKFVPFTVPSDTRVLIFNKLVEIDKSRFDTLQDQVTFLHLLLAMYTETGTERRVLQSDELPFSKTASGR